MHPRRRLGALRVLLAVLMLSAALVGGTLSSAQAATATITGKVVSAANASTTIAGADVELEVATGDDEDWDFVDDVTTGSDGRYSFSGLVTGKTYRIYVFAPSGYVSPTPDVFVVKSSGTRPDVALQVAGTMSGTVTDAVSHEPIEDVSIVALPVDGDADFQGAMTDEHGDFVVDSLAPGNYKVQISDVEGDHLAEYYDNATTIDDATQVHVVAGQDVPLNPIQLSLGAKVTGSIDDGAGHAVGDAFIEAYQVDENGRAIEDQRYYGFSDDDGTYSIGGLPTGDYQLDFTADDYVDRYYRNQDTIKTATTVHLTASTATPLSAESLIKGGAIAGAAKNTSGAPLEGIDVKVYPVVGGHVDTDQGYVDETDETGAFHLGGLPAGRYRLALSDQDGMLYRDVFYGGTSLDNASDISAELGKNTSIGTVTMQLINPPHVDPPPAGKAASRIKIKVSPGKKKAKVTVTVTSPGQVPTGRVTIKVGSRHKVVTLKHGKATITFTRLTKGTKTVTTSYPGNANLLPARAHAKAKITR